MTADLLLVGAVLLSPLVLAVAAQWWLDDDLTADEEEAP